MDWSLFYQLVFTPSIEHDIWNSMGFPYGFFILIGINFALTFFYYIIIGRKTNDYANSKSWYTLLGLSMFMVFIISLTVIGFKVFEYSSMSEISNDVRIFSIWNGTLYTGIIFFLFSLLLKKFSTHNFSTPF